MDGTETVRDHPPLQPLFLKTVQHILISDFASSTLQIQDPRPGTEPFKDGPFHTDHDTITSYKVNLVASEASQTAVFER